MLRQRRCAHLSRNPRDQHGEQEAQVQYVDAKGGANATGEIAHEQGQSIGHMEQPQTLAMIAD